MTVKLLLLVAVPPAVLKDTVPVIAPGITIPTRLLPVLEITMAFAPPILKMDGLVKFVPVIVTRVPTAP
jgi:hypothetical protein